MRWGRTAGAMLFALGLVGCDQIPFIGKKETKAPPGRPAAVPPAPTPDTSARVARATPAPAPRLAAQPVDEPWTPIDTGTVLPGMTREQVIAVWGVPVAERQQDNWTYLYFRNGCEASCGTFDVVFLENGQVVDAVVRGPGHNYAGVSSSPPGRTPEPTAPGGDTVRVGA